MADSSVFDIALLLQSTCDDRELAGQVATVFVTDMPTQLADLKQAVAGNDAKTAERIAHSIKGVAATVGANILRETALECENAGREGRLDFIHSRLETIDAQFADVRQALADQGLITR